MASQIKYFIVKWLSLTILRTSSQQIKSAYRKLERLKIRIVKLRSHLSFNETCKINQLLPTYTNVRLHDDAATAESFVLEFRLNLVERQIKEHKSAILSLESEYIDSMENFKLLVNSDMKLDAYVAILNRVCAKKEVQMRQTQLNKLIRMYGGDIWLKQNRDSVINLSSIELNPDIKDIFSLGMNCHLKQRYDQTKKKVEVEILYENIKEKVKMNKIKLVNDENLKSDLESFGMKQHRNYNKDLLTKEQYAKVKQFNQIDNIVTRRADKSNVFVILDKSYYVREINNLLSDESKFQKITRDPTDGLKRELNKHINIVNSTSKSIRISKRVGKYDPGYVYGNPKIHKQLLNPPLRPIISQIGTVTYEVSKQLNNIIVKYMPRKHTVKSTYEFVTMIKDKLPNGKLASLDVESLFTNVPVKQTIKIILKHVYQHAELPPPDIPPATLEELLTICTTKTPFRNIDGQLYVQREGVSMGSALGPTFADFYMCNLENEIFEEYPELKPLIYVRYVDDCFVLVNNYHSLQLIKEKFEANSVLKFTFETEKNKQVPFLDTIVKRYDLQFKTSVYVKSTNAGDCINYNSICPDRYKTGVIKTLLHRGYHTSSDWFSFHEEIKRIKQLLTNNNFPMKAIDREVKDFLDKILRQQEPTAAIPNNKIELFFQGQMCSNYKVEEKQLKTIIEKNVQPVDDNHHISLRIYYKNKKLHNLFIRNKPISTNEVSDRHHVVYLYECKQAGCNAKHTYIGYTTCTVGERFRSHTQTGSIKKHLVETHGITRIPKSDLLQTTKVLKTCNSVGYLRMTEAMMIKDLKPTLNSQDEGCDLLLKIFKH